VGSRMDRVLIILLVPAGPLGPPEYPDHVCSSSLKVLRHGEAVGFLP
jgi:hypothetical protein